jgi:hypothetical protein
MIRFLESPGISPRERVDALESIHLLEGIDAMYSRILEGIQAKFSAEVRTVFKVFQWLIVAKRALQWEQLRTAIALRVQQTCSPELDYIADFSQAQYKAKYLKAKQYTSVHPWPGVSIMIAGRKSIFYLYMHIQAD